MKVPFLNMAGPYQELKSDLDAAWHRVMDSAWLVLGLPIGPNVTLEQRRHVIAALASLI